MASRTISLADDAYDLLKATKEPGESFSDVVRRLAARPSPLDFAGAWEDMDDDEARAVKRELKEARRAAVGKTDDRLRRWDA